MKKRIYGAVCAIALALMCPLIAGAVNFGVRQDHPGDSSLNENPSKPHQGYLLDGPMAPDGDSETPTEKVNAASFTVTFHPGDGATVSPESKRVTNGYAYGKLPAPEKNGYAFQGWVNSAGIRISANTVVNLTADQTLYAVWSVQTYDVTFDANGGTVGVPGVEIPIGGNYGELPRPIRNGYVFDGWHTLPRGGERILSYEKLTRLENHTLYAHWIASPEISSEDYAADDDVFQDVPSTSIYYAAVNWAVKRGITSGTSPETFSPNDLCKRRHILTFLWRANGCPDTQRAYSSVLPGTMWAYESGLIPREVLYHDEEASTRSDAVTYLWKLAGSPAVDTPLQAALERFTDVSPESECAPAIAWALDAGITNGTTDTTFSPDRICTRGQIVTFLYRCYR